MADVDPPLPSSDPPLLSVVVAVYRHWHLVPGLLDALAAQRLPAGRFETVLVDNAPGEARPPVALPAGARIVPCGAPGSYAARNAGAATARGQLLAFTDADCRPAPGWLAAMAEAWEAAPQGALLAGPVTMIGSARPNRHELYDLIRGIPQARYVRHGYAATANLAVPAAVFRRLGGFDACRFSGGDAEFCRRAGAAGHPLRFVPAAEVLHPARDRWEELAAKARRVKGGQVGAGTRWQRAVWLARTATPPLRATLRFLRADRPWTERCQALGVLYALWLVELHETGRILAGKLAERA